ncbi:imm11 family protein [Exiguobacterium sp. KRL4]|uniref:imm11 family protein n=1 Tax=Exiguobacterium sp. KRL4 TaxID=1914536 RepID=UPI000AB48585|nr:DUF1629 domain-containing protein [Exiguobacterium sp. KRL4]
MNKVRVWSEQPMGKGWMAICHHQIDRYRFTTGEWFLNASLLAFSIEQDADMLPDVLPNELNIPLVSERMKQTLERLTPFSIQCLRVQLKTRSGLSNYYLINILAVRRVEHLHKTEIFRTIRKRQVYFMTERIVSESLGPHHILRDERTNRIFLSNTLARYLEQLAVTGVHFGEINRMEEII